MWLVFAILVPFFFAGVFILDSYCVDDVFEKPWIGMITSSIVSLVVFAPIPLIAPLIDWTVPSQAIAGIAILAGVIDRQIKGETGNRTIWDLKGERDDILEEQKIVITDADPPDVQDMTDIPLEEKIAAALRV